MLCRIGLLFLTISYGMLVAVLPARAEGSATTDNTFFAGIESECKVPRALTAVMREPAVRIVVFDPISNSFSFVACPRAMDDPLSTKNRDFLDRRRLALPTQKIRLLVLPYNPDDGDLNLKVTRGQGVEFEEISVGGKPPTTVAATASTGTPKKEEPPATKGEAPKEPKEPRIPAKLESLILKYEAQLERLLVGANDPYETIETFAFEFDEGEEDFGEDEDQGEDEDEEVFRRLAAMKKQIEEYLSEGRKQSINLRTLEQRSACIREAVRMVSRDLSGLLAIRDSGSFNYGRDVTLQEVLEEAKRRTGLVKELSYKACDSKLPTSSSGFEDDVRSLEEKIIDLMKGVQAGRAQIDPLRSNLEWFASQNNPPIGVTIKDWLDLLEELRTTVAQAEKFQEDIEARVNALFGNVPERRKDHESLRKSFESPAMQLQRFNFRPLANGESITFTVGRGPNRLAQEEATIVLAQVNTLELRSAPAYTARFGIGLVVSELENPTFKLGPSRIISFDDEGNGLVIPGIFIHHYWGRRSPLLNATWFEKLMPTLSLGIPLETEIFDEVLFGLDWELITGIELNLGVHYGRVNSLARGVKVGDPLPEGIDLGLVQKKKFDNAFYIGIILNRDIFSLFQNQQGQQNGN